MNSLIVITIFLCYGFTSASGRSRLPIINPYGKFQEMDLAFDEDPGEPLFLTPYIEQNLISEAKTAAEVHLKDFQSVASYAGYFTVDKNFDSNMFFWFFPSENQYETDPVLLWLQGGPGASGTLGLFAELGPFIINNDGQVELREISWTKNHSVIFVDNPVGTGYSFTNGDGYAKNETKVGESLYSLMSQFYAVFPELLNNDFIITGESYAGKYIPALAYTIHKKNPTASVKIPLKGISIGNGLSDPANQLQYSELLYQLGLIDLQAKKTFKDAEDLVLELCSQGDYLNALKIWDIILNGDFNNGKTLFANRTGFSNYYNFLYPVNPVDTNNVAPFLQKADVRKAIHVGNLSIHGGDMNVETALEEDILQSVAPWISELLSNYRVLIYNGQLDIIVAYALTVNYLQQLEWSAAEEYKVAPRNFWYVDNDLAGYVKLAGNLTEVLVRNAGHLVPSDQPKWAYDMIYKFVRNLDITKNVEI